MVVVALLVFFCLAMEGASSGTYISDSSDISERSNILTVKLYAKGSEQEKYYGLWDVRNVSVNGVLVGDRLFSVAGDLYVRSGKSDFLEALMDEMRKSGCVGPQFKDKKYVDPLEQGIQGVERELTWQTTFLSIPLRVQENISQREEASLVCFEKFDLAVRICTRDLTIGGFAERCRTMAPKEKPVAYNDKIAAQALSY